MSHRVCTTARAAVLLKIERECQVRIVIILYCLGRVCSAFASSKRLSGASMVKIDFNLRSLSIYRSALNRGC